MRSAMHSRSTSATPLCVETLEAREVPAIVLAGTFATLLLSRIAFLEQVGLGLTVGVLIDTGLVRPFLLPAAALLLQGENG